MHASWWKKIWKSETHREDREAVGHLGIRPEKTSNGENDSDDR
jgi:hypothetical protein